MAEASPAREAYVNTSDWKYKLAYSSATLFVLAVTTFFALVSLRAPAPASEDAAPSEFSSARAMRHLRIIANDPRPIGSESHLATRNYILGELAALNVPSEIQETSVVGQRWLGPFQAATVRNILARIDGSEGSKTILLVAHYDSVPSSPGASDNGGAVASLLETIRALKSGPQSRNNLLFLFTDAEELGLLGAKAFVEEHPSAKNVSLVLNFDSRGSSGRSIMFETTANNSWLISEYSKAAPYALANSLSQDIYKLLPNDTDLTMFKEAGIQGLNFANIDSPSNYHSATDKLANYDERTLQHIGSQALSLARRFGEIEIEANPKGDAVYFNTIGSHLIRYPAVLVLPLSLLILGLFLLVIYKGLNSKELTVKGLGIGVMAYAVALIVIPAVIWLLWWIVKLIKLQKGQLGEAELNNSKLYMAGFVAAAIAMMGAMYVYWRRKAGEKELAAGGLAWIAVAMMVMSVSMKGGSYLVSWPMMMSVIGMWYWMRGREKGEEGIKQYVVMMISAIPALFLIVPYIYLMHVALTLDMIVPIMVLVTGLLGLLIPHLKFLAEPNKWAAPILFAIISIAFIVAGSLELNNGIAHPKQSSILYGLSADSGRAIWASGDEHTDEWNSQFLSGDLSKGALPEYFPFSQRQFLKNPAKAIDQPPPEITVLEDKKGPDVRTLRLQIKSPRQAPVMSIFIHPDCEVLASSINGKMIYTDAATRNQMRNRWTLIYSALPKEGIQLSLDLRLSPMLKIRVVDRSYGLPQLPSRTIQPRSESFVVSSFSFSDSTYISKSFEF